MRPDVGVVEPCAAFEEVLRQQVHGLLLHGFGLVASDVPGYFVHIASVELHSVFVECSVVGRLCLVKFAELLLQVLQFSGVQVEEVGFGIRFRAVFLSPLA